jgi:Domain of unknown function DUF302
MPDSDYDILSLQKAGFRIVFDADVQAMLKEKLAVDVGRYRLLSVCNAWLTHQAISIEPDSGLLVLSTIAVREEKHRWVRISFSAPDEVLALAGRNDLLMLGKELRFRLEAVCDAVARELMKLPLAVAAD